MKYQDKNYYKIQKIIKILLHQIHHILLNKNFKIKQLLTHKPHKLKISKKYLININNRFKIKISRLFNKNSPYHKNNKFKKTFSC